MKSLLLVALPRPVAALPDSGRLGGAPRSDGNTPCQRSQCSVTACDEGIKIKYWMA